jgi:hypothetical protein
MNIDHKMYLLHKFIDLVKEPEIIEKEEISEEKMDEIVEKSMSGITPELPVEESRGPRASPGKTQFTYNNRYNPERFFTNMIKMGKIKQNELCFNVNNQRILIEKNRMAPTKETKENIKKCMESPARFVALGVSLHFGRFAKQGHSTMIIIDKKEKIAEHFDSSFILAEKKWNLVTMVVKTQVVRKLLGREYKYIKMWEVCPNINVQARVDAFRGMCVTWATMFTYLRIKNPDVTRERMSEYMNTIDRKKLLQFAKLMENVIKMEK